MLFLTLFERMTVVALAAYFFTHTLIFKKINKTKYSIREKLILIVFFSIFSIMGTYLGIKVEGGAIANIRPIGAIVAGYIGGPFVGVAVGIIAGFHRYFLGGFTALACGIATVFEGLTGSLFRNKNGELSSFIGLIAGIVAEFIQMTIILLTTTPYDQALELVREIALPMIIINSLGVAIFIDIIKSVHRQFNEVAATYALKSLNIAKQTSVYLRKGLNIDTAQKVAEIIKKIGDFKGVVIGDNQRVLKYIGKGIDEGALTVELKDFFDKPREKVLQINLSKESKYFYVAPFNSNSFEGFIGIELNSLDDVDNNFREFINELSELLSVQIEIYRLNKKAEMAAVSELKALRAQIHPHFLFNALNTIASFCRINPLKAKELIIDLSNYFRATLKSDEFVTLRKEIELIEAYLNIEKARFGDRIKVNYDVDDSALDLIVPHFILQPLVENAIKHGITPKLEGGEVEVIVKEFEETLCFEVKDTGIGIKEQDLEEIKNTKKGIGLSNVRDRLNLIYGNNALFEITSVYGAGTNVKFVIPKGAFYGKDKMYNC